MIINSSHELLWNKHMGQEDVFFSVRPSMYLLIYPPVYQPTYLSMHFYVRVLQGWTDTRPTYYLTRAKRGWRENATFDAIWKFILATPVHTWPWRLVKGPRFTCLTTSYLDTHEARKLMHTIFSITKTITIWNFTNEVMFFKIIFVFIVSTYSDNVNELIEVRCSMCRNEWLVTSLY